MTYVIEVTYDSGDSYETRPNQKEILELTWEDLSVAKDNLKRIQEHYEFYKKLYSANYTLKDKIKKDMIRQRWGVENDPERCLKLATDDGGEWQILAFWTGYFETLRGAEIIIDNKDMKFEL